VQTFTGSPGRAIIGQKLPLIKAVAVLLGMECPTDFYGIKDKS
jgi:hypothetical protein